MFFAGSDQENADYIERTHGAIGAIGLAVILSERRKLRPLRLDGGEPSIAALSAGKYKLSKPLYLVVRGTPTPATRRFLAFVASAHAQRDHAQRGHSAGKRRGGRSLMRLARTKISWRLTGFARLIALLVAASVPVIYASYTGMSSTLNARAEGFAVAVNRLVSAAPDLWQCQHYRIEVQRRQRLVAPLSTEHARVYDAADRLVVEVGACSTTR
jgi:hypothetical protein